MKNIIYYVIIALSIVFIIGVFYKKPKVLAYDKDRNLQLKTKVTVDTTLIDLGDVKLKSSIYGKFVLHNVGDADFAIENVMTNCSCTRAQYSKASFKPNDFDTVVLKYDSTRMGLFQSTGIVASNATSGPILLILRGNVIGNLK